MDIGACINRIEKYLKKENVQPYIVDVQTPEQMSSICTRFKVGDNIFISAGEFCNKDEFLRVDDLLHAMSNENGVVFVTGLSSYLKLQGEHKLKETIKNILSMSIQGHVVVLTYQCKKFLEFNDPRLKNRNCILEGEGKKTSLVFTTKDIASLIGKNVVDGIHNLATEIESIDCDKLYIVTSKNSNTFPLSLLPITELNKAYTALCMIDSLSSSVAESFGTEEQWKYALDKIDEYKSWHNLIDAEFSNHSALEFVVSSYSSFDEDKKWLYFIALKMFGTPNNWALSIAVNNATTYKTFVKQVFRALLTISHKDKNYWQCYKQRKELVKQISPSLEDVTEYCKLVVGKEKDAICYLTDNTQKERKLIFELLDKYGLEYSKEELLRILSSVYPDLRQYLSDYHFNIPLLDNYFSQYKYQKVINKVFPEFVELVDEQAEKREYNLLLQPRTSVVHNLDKNGAQLYFVDAMGVEYLGYIMYLCKELGLATKVFVCSCELPSVTECNKEFIDEFSNCQAPMVPIKDLDEIKHHGEGDFDYQKTKIPVYLSRELEIIREFIEKIKAKLVDETIEKAVVIADHGASRLAVLNGSDNLIAMENKAEHSGRCCLKSAVDTKPSCATDAGDYWSLANYDRFKGGRRANVEVHGGATLEEVTVPVIEITNKAEEIEVYLMKVDSDTIDFSKTPEISVSFRKKAVIKVFTSKQVSNLSVSIAGYHYKGVPQGDNYYVVEMPDIKRAKMYELDVYADGEIVASNLSLKVISEGMGTSGKGIL